MRLVVMEHVTAEIESVVGRRSSVVVLGTRRSKLALAQTHMVREALLAAHPGLTVALEEITTKGDVILDRPLSAIGDKGLFVVEIEEVMRAGRIDAAVHSAKDLPSELPPDMALAALPRRADARDALISHERLRLAELPAGALVGTSSLRRACQLRALRPDLRIEDLRGNVDTRLRKLHEGQYDAIVLAAAGLVRLGLDHEVAEFLEPEQMIPAVGQGVMAVEARSGDEGTAALFAPLDHAESRAAITAERAFLAKIGGGCQVPVGAFARLEAGSLRLVAMIGARDGRQVRGELSGAASEPAALGVALAEELLGSGGRELLALVEH
jgi:hydroxymethylbilane synthase